MSVASPLVSAGTSPARPGWTGVLWSDISATFDAILEHPFMLGLTSGDLDPVAFAYFLAQDAEYIREYVKALVLLAAKAPAAATTRFMTEHAIRGLQAESDLHERLIADLGGDPKELATVAVSPTTTAYTSYVLAVTHQGSFADGLSAILPCSWIYGQVGEYLQAKGSPHPVYQRWIDTYAGPEYQTEMTASLELMDAIGLELVGSQQVRSRTIFATAARYEWMFWDAAWRREAWPI